MGRYKIEYFIGLTESVVAFPPYITRSMKDGRQQPADLNLPVRYLELQHGSHDRILKRQRVMKQQYNATTVQS